MAVTFPSLHMEREGNDLIICEPLSSIPDHVDRLPAAGKGTGVAVGAAVVPQQSLKRVDPGSGSPGLPLPIIPFESEV